MSEQERKPSPELFLRTINAFQQTEVIKGAIELDVFTAIAEGNTTPAALAAKCSAAERGMRILCDYLTVLGFLEKEAGQYSLTQDSAHFLDRRSRAYVGSVTEFLLAPTMFEAFKDMAAVVRNGGAVFSEEGAVSPENPVWVRFARGMMPLMWRHVHLLAELVEIDKDLNRKIKVLDIAASHGLYGITLAQQSPQVEVVALDWAPVLEVARENAQKFGVSDRYHLLPGSAFDVDFGSGFDLVLLPNFLHHFDIKTNESLLKKVHAALNEGGRAVTLDFIPNEDRVTPAPAATFSMTMLATTPSGDAYTFSELEKMFANAGFESSEFHSLPQLIQDAVISYK
jgi:2-polyprenyl-3-methyl-5-hydroxy-6-metoxy-1,4-benzoquinol methylase